MGEITCRICGGAIGGAKGKRRTSLRGERGVREVGGEGGLGGFEGA